MKEPTLPAHNCPLHHCRLHNCSGRDCCPRPSGPGCSITPQCHAGSAALEVFTSPLTRSHIQATGADGATHLCTLRSLPGNPAAPLSRYCVVLKVIKQRLPDSITFGSHWHWLEHNIPILRQVVQREHLLKLHSRAVQLPAALQCGSSCFLEPTSRRVRLLDNLQGSSSLATCSAAWTCRHQSEQALSKRLILIVMPREIGMLHQRCTWLC